MAPPLLKENELILWKDLLDLGVDSSFAFLKKRRGDKAAQAELKAALYRQSQEHWQGLYGALLKLR